MSIVNKAEQRFIDAYGHSSTCNCIRLFRGRDIITRRSCDCGTLIMTHEKAYNQAVSELGEMTENNHTQIIERIKQIKANN